MKLHNKLKKSLQVGESYDALLGVSYILGTANAQELSEYLKGNLSKNGLKPNDFNRESKNYHGQTVQGLKNPPVEIYEYQSFFLMERANGELILLDGFRRLLWYNAPDHQIQVRVYKENEITNEQVIKMLVYLNHFKFFGGSGEYYDRGFALAMKVIFNLEIPNFYSAFDGYLSKNDLQRGHSYEHIEDQKQNTSVKARITNPMFVDDMRFLETISQEKIMCNDLMGALVFSFRKNHPSKKFDVNTFIKEATTNKNITEIYAKYKKIGNGTGAEASKWINQLMQLYTNVFKQMLGIEVEKTFAEKKAETKELIAALKKDKGYSLLTNSKNSHIIEAILFDRLAKDIPINVKVIIHPSTNEIDQFATNHYNEDGRLPYGLRTDLKFIELGRGSVIDPYKLYFGVTVKGTYYRTDLRYGEIQIWGGKSVAGQSISKIDIYVDVTKEEIEAKDNDRRNWHASEVIAIEKYYKPKKK